jgi:hypothetical protein
LGAATKVRRITMRMVTWAVVAATQFVGQIEIIGVAGERDRRRCVMVIDAGVAAIQLRLACRVPLWAAAKTSTVQSRMKRSGHSARVAVAVAVVLEGRFGRERGNLVAGWNALPYPHHPSSGTARCCSQNYGRSGSAAAVTIGSSSRHRHARVSRRAVAVRPTRARVGLVQGRQMRHRLRRF